MLSAGVQGRMQREPKEEREEEGRRERGKSGRRRGGKSGREEWEGREREEGEERRCDHPGSRSRRCHCYRRILANQGEQVSRSDNGSGPSDIWAASRRVGEGGGRHGGSLSMC
jgi:hypothetical protein